MIIEAKEFLRPNGRQVKITAKAPEWISPNYDKMIESGFWLEAEELTTGQVSFTISSCLNEDLDIICVPNGPGVLQAVCEMIRENFP